MHRSLQSLLTEIVDYAGLFPPAKLELEPALRNYADYLRGNDAWMLARFVCPVGKLEEVIPLLDLFAAHHPLRISLIPRPADSTAAFVDAFDDVLEAVARFDEQAGDRAAIDAMEARWPDELVSATDPAAFSELLQKIDAACERQSRPSVRPAFWELPPTADHWPEVLAVAAQAIRAHNLEAVDGGGRVAPGQFCGLKLRTGGVESAAFPSSKTVAAYIKTAIQHETPIKFTAGLHHPFQHQDPAVRAVAQGFVNVFVAGVLGTALALDHFDLLAILDERDPTAFSFTDEGVAWNDAEATCSEIEFARRSRVISFGSCSFDEPREDLRALGLLT